MINPEELERAVERVEEVATGAPEYGVYPGPPTMRRRAIREDLRLILSANREMRAALERIADPRNIHFAGDAQVVARSALTTQRGDGE